LKTRNAISKWREIKKVSQVDLADHLGINRALLSQIETGIVLPSDEMLVGISRYLNCLITDLEIKEEKR